MNESKKAQANLDPRLFATPRSTNHASNDDTKGISGISNQNRIRKRSSNAKIFNCYIQNTNNSENLYCRAYVARVYAQIAAKILSFPWICNDTPLALEILRPRGGKTHHPLVQHTPSLVRLRQPPSQFLLGEAKITGAEAVYLRFFALLSTYFNTYTQRNLNQS